MHFILELNVKRNHEIVWIFCYRLVFISVLVVSIAPYHAYPSYQNSVPNGNKVPNPCQNGVVWSGIGHQLPKGGGALNPFGNDLFQQKLLNEEVILWYQSNDVTKIFIYCTNLMTSQNLSIVCIIIEWNTKYNENENNTFPYFYS
jgi:hypothetical protein